jgi:hypothetical protein
MAIGTACHSQGVGRFVYAQSGCQDRLETLLQKNKLSYCAEELDSAPVFPEMLVQPAYPSTSPIEDHLPPYCTCCRIPA